MTAIQKTNSWSGFSKLEDLIIFLFINSGDSYSDVGYSPAESPPGELEPLEVEYPGSTWADGANWVRYLATEYNQSLLVVFDYAKGGERTANLRYHLEREFLPQLGDKPEFAPWTKNNSLFATWIGINDLASTLVDPVSAMERVFCLQEKLYETGARNFLLIDVPPIHRCPGVPLSSADSWKGRYGGWNAALRTALSEFASSHPDATILLYSSWDLFSRIFDDPTAHGFKETDPKKRGGGIWADHLHPTSAVHRILAEDLAKFLEAQKVEPIGK